MSDRYSKAPWTQEQVDSLNGWQQCGVVHPFTCGGERGDEAHVKYQSEFGGDFGQLVATPQGWICPVCGDKQDWAHEFMADGSWRETFKQSIEWQRNFNR